MIDISQLTAHSPDLRIPHRDLTRTVRFVADASGLASLDMMHAPQSSPAFSLRSEVSMLPAPWHTRPLRSSWHVG